MYMFHERYGSRVPTLAIGVFETLADPTRRRILEALREGERSVSDIVAVVDIEQPGVSRHLRILHDAGFVQVRPEGQRRLYALREEPFEELEAWMRQFVRTERERVGRLADFVDGPSGKSRTTKNRK
jgi:DNA-binding transcriptional ArsR family regulator